MTGSVYGASRPMRRGLPRRIGEEPWPPSGTGVDRWANSAAITPQPAAGVAAAPVASPPIEGAESDPHIAAAKVSDMLRRGLPRTADGEPWPPASAGGVLGAMPPSTVASDVSASVVDAAEVLAPRRPAPGRAGTQAGDMPVAVRRGLPRTADGEPWPPAGQVPVRWSRFESELDPVEALEPESEPVVASVPTRDVSVSIAAPAETAAPAAPAPPAAPVVAAMTQRPAPRHFFGINVRTLVLGGVGLVMGAFAAVLAAQWFRAQSFGQDFLASYPGETHLPEGAPVGLPAWLGWQHFFNMFFMVLIIRSGLQVRAEKRPSAYWTPKWNRQRKISLTLWLHQSLDILWLLNGVVFVFLLLATGQWMRVVPTEWGVFPNAFSAAIQYLSLDWPTENGWVNYNSLQVLAYFTTIFIAAPLAVVTGVRMSGIWPKNATRLNKAFPLEWARAVHFPVMLYFCAFIVVHVALVLSTGLLRNLNHMYAAEDSTNWWGLVIFLVSLMVLLGGWLAARPLVIASIASLFGTVKSR